jgi:hypothetical protein
LAKTNKSSKAINDSDKKPKNNWAVRFRVECTEMRRRGVTRRNLPNGGTITRHKEEICVHCKKKTMPYVGVGVDCGKLYHTTVAKFCPVPGCGRMDVFDDSYDLYAETPHGFLPVFRNKLASGIFGNEIHRDGICPMCGKQRYVYSAIKDGVRAHAWKVCADPKCDYAGEYVSPAEDIAKNTVCKGTNQN